jgi:putative aminopeptidase FrvX
MTKIILALTLAISSLSTFAHGDRDWSSDYMGFLSVNYDWTFKPAPKAKPHQNRIDVEYFKKNLSTLTGLTAFNGAMITERGSTANLDKTRSFLKAEYEKLGFTVSFQPFSSGANFIAEKKGLNPNAKILVLSSHIDSVGNAGANDNGTGTIGNLAIAKELASKNFENTLLVLGFDREERGLVGSDFYVAAISNKADVLGNINFEMMGTNSRKDGAFHIIDCDYDHSTFMTKQLHDSIQNLGLEISVVKGCTNRSDHASFWRHQIPAVVISENFFGGDSDRCYHARCDVMDGRLDYEYMAKIMEMVLDTTEKLLEPKL